MNRPGCLNDWISDWYRVFGHLKFLNHVSFCIIKFLGHIKFCSTWSFWTTLVFDHVQFLNYVKLLVLSSFWTTLGFWTRRVLGQCRVCGQWCTNPRSLKFFQDLNVKESTHTTSLDLLSHPSSHHTRTDTDLEYSTLTPQGFCIRRFWKHQVFEYNWVLNPIIKILIPRAPNLFVVKFTISRGFYHKKIF